MGLYEGDLTRVIVLLQREGRVTYRALQRDFGFDAQLLDDLRHELVFKRLALDEQGQGLVWTGGVAPLGAGALPSAPPPEAVALPPLALAAPAPPAVSSRAAAQAAPPPADRLPLAAPPPRPEATRSDGPCATSRALPPMAADIAPIATPPNGPAVVRDRTATSPAAGPESAAVEDAAAPGPAAGAPEPIRHAPEAERRQVTVLFCDLVDSTKLSQHLDAEDYRAVVRAYQQTAVTALQPWDGYVAQYLGDGLMVYFGWPTAHEDAAVRAVHASLALLAALEPFNTTQLGPRYGVRVQVRLGVHTGMAVIGDMGGGDRHEQLAMGETPNIAARLQGLAAPDTVVLSAVTARLVQRRFALETLGTHQLKGVTEPLQVFRVLGVPDTADDEEATTPGRAVFLVGRDEELGLLRRRWEQSKAGLGQVVLLRGEAGIGKSSLVETLRAQVRREGFTRVAVRCSPYHTNSALYRFPKLFVENTN